MIGNIAIGLLIVVAVIMTICAGRFALIIVRVEEELELALDKLDGSYNAIGKILERPLFFDSPEVRSVLNELRNAQRAILGVASALSATMAGPAENKKEDLNP